MTVGNTRVPLPPVATPRPIPHGWITTSDTCGIGVQAVLVTTPCYITYNEHLDSAQLDSYVTVAKEVAAENSLRWVDLLTDSRFIADDFWDADHLNNRGATKLTHLLRDTL